MIIEIINTDGEREFVLAAKVEGWKETTVYTEDNRAIPAVEIGLANRFVVAQYETAVTFVDRLKAARGGVHMQIHNIDAAKNAEIAAAGGVCPVDRFQRRTRAKWEDDLYAGASTGPETIRDLMTGQHTRMPVVGVDGDIDEVRRLAAAGEPFIDIHKSRDTVDAAALTPITAPEPDAAPLPPNGQIIVDGVNAPEGQSEAAPGKGKRRT